MDNHHAGIRLGNHRSKHIPNTANVRTVIYVEFAAVGDKKERDVFKTGILYVSTLSDTLLGEVR